MLRDQPDFGLWIRQNRPPDLQILVSTYGSYSDIPAEAWADYDQRMLDWDVKRRTRLGQLLKDRREIKKARKSR